jgi:hypothetical protein
MSPGIALPISRPTGAGSRFILPLVLVSLLIALPAFATTYTWINSSGGNWSDASSWSPAGVPSGSGDIAKLPILGGNYTVNLDANPAIGEVDLSTQSTLDLGSYSLASVDQVFNTGKVLNFRGMFDSDHFHNQTSGVIQVGANDSMTISHLIHNDGTILIGPNQQNAFYVTDSCSIGGSGSIFLMGNGRFNCPLPRPQTKIWIKNAAGHTLGGSGDCWVPIKNYGTILQDGTYGSLFTQWEYTDNYGTVRVSNGATINIDLPYFKQFNGKIVGSDGTFTVMMPYQTGGPIDNLNGGSLVADGGDLRIGAGVIANGSIERTGGSGAVAIISVATPSYLVIQPNAELRVDGLMDVGVDKSTIENHGVLRVHGTLNFDGADNIGIAIVGDGQMVLDGGTIGSPAGCWLTNGAGHTITGCGTITANIVNNGVIDVNCPNGGSESMTDCQIVNHNAVNVKVGNLFMGGQKFTLYNYGVLSGAGGGVRLQDGGVIQNSTGSQIIAGSNNFYLGWRQPAATVLGGVLTCTAGGIFSNAGSVNLNAVTIGSGATLRTVAGTTTHITGGSLTNKGTSYVDFGGTINVDAGYYYLQQAGATTILKGTLKVPTGSMQLQGTLSGTGTVVGNVSNTGIISPDNSTTSLKIQGDYAQLSGGQLNIGIAGTSAGQFGKLTVTGNATLDGTVAVATSNGFVPTPGQDFQVMAFASRAGQFAQTQTNPGLQVAPLYNPADVTLQAVSALGVTDPGALPATLRFYSRGVGFALELPAAAEVSVRAYDVSGREVAVLASGPRPAGIYRLDMRGNEGALPSGLYFARATIKLSKGTEVRSAKLALLR